MDGMVFGGRSLIRRDVDFDTTIPAQTRDDASLNVSTVNVLKRVLSSLCFFP